MPSHAEKAPPAMVVICLTTLPLLACGGVIVSELHMFVVWSDIGAPCFVFSIFSNIVNCFENSKGIA